MQAALYKPKHIAKPFKHSAELLRPKERKTKSSAECLKSSAGYLRTSAACLCYKHGLFRPNQPRSFYHKGTAKENHTAIKTEKMNFIKRDLVTTGAV